MQPVQAYTLPPDLYAKAIEFANTRHVLHFGGVAFTLLVLYLILRVRVAQRLARWPSPAYFAFILLLTALCEIPLDAAAHHVSRHFGISNQAWPSWFWDWSKEQMLTVLLGTALLWPLYILMRRRPHVWWLLAWVAALPLMVLITYADPLVVEPLFNHFSPLGSRHPDLIPQIERLLQHAGIAIAPDHLFEMSASEKTNALNAYMSGFGPSRRLVLYDTIIRQEEGPMLLTTIGHELGHYVLQHIPKGLMVGAMGLLAGMWLLHLGLASVIRVRGDSLGIRSVADRASLPVFLIVGTLLSFCSEPFANWYSRQQEHEADLYSLEVTHGIIADPGQAAARAFQIEGQLDLDVPDPDPFIVFWLYSHPPTAERLRFSLEYDPWRDGQKPRFLPY